MLPFNFESLFTIERVILLLIILNIVFYAITMRFYYRVNQHDPEPKRKIVIVSLFGVLAFTIIGILNIVVNFIIFGQIDIAIVQSVELHPVQIVLAIPLMEEITKDSMLYLFYRMNRDRFDTPLDGLVYGGLLGGGFAIAENMMYSFRGVFGLGVTEGFVITLIRGALMIVGHPLFTGLFGFGLVMKNISKPRLIFRYFFFGVIAHFFWNFVSISTVLFTNIDFYLSLFFLVVLVLTEFVYLLYLIAHVYDIEKELIKLGYYSSKRDFKIGR